MRNQLIEARGLSRTFGSRVIVNSVNLDIGAGECLAIFGPNGAGKTTLLYAALLRARYRYAAERDDLLARGSL